ncbi:MAG: N-acetyltransferase [Shimia sp.]|uniref:GNAT family N-acetyltransferase n=1 Tax=Shimia sp. TaxID=1954381 RepID=UPI001B2AE081|nr:N-acetyltransferase [Shimia sp.]MBO6898337.1 N-acetyltransferase [Shimia sp.]
MIYAEDVTPNTDAIIRLFAETFAASEGAAEGALIGDLVTNLLKDRPTDGSQVFTATDDGTLVAAVLFSPMLYSNDPRRVVLLSPMAVTTDRHGEGIGQALITHALTTLRDQGAEVAITYGSPDFYGKTGFLPLTEDTAPAPQPLSFPHGWIGQSLTDAPLTPLKGTPRCVAALNDPQFW